MDAVPLFYKNINESLLCFYVRTCIDGKNIHPLYIEYIEQITYLKKKERKKLIF